MSKHILSQNATVQLLLVQMLKPSKLYIDSKIIHMLVCNPAKWSGYTCNTSPKSWVNVQGLQKYEHFISWTYVWILEKYSYSATGRSISQMPELHLIKKTKTKFSFSLALIMVLLSYNSWNTAYLFCHVIPYPLP